MSLPTILSGNQSRRWLVAFSACCAFTIQFAGEAAAQQPPPPQPDVPQVEFTGLNRGLVHEAFAQPYHGSSPNVLVVKDQPPARINETPPAIGPGSRDFIWIPGYWGWEDPEQRFIWISGVWRRPPLGATWNPGFWQKVTTGYAWVSGFWSQEDNLPLFTERPPRDRQEDRGEAPSEQHFWAPGHWAPQGDQFDWQAGFWARGRENLVWMPLQYHWTPSGYIMVPGYWDYELEDRGVLFNPVVFSQTVTAQTRYSPETVVLLEQLPVHLFVDTTYCHYYYGDYYQTRLPDNRFFAWSQNRQYYDPLQVFYLTFQQNRFNTYRTRHAYFRDHADLRPRHTWRDEQIWRKRGNVSVGDALLSAGINLLLDGNYGRRGTQFSRQPGLVNQFLRQGNQFAQAREDRQRRYAQARQEDNADQRNLAQRVQQLEQRQRDRLREGPRNTASINNANVSDEANAQLDRLREQQQKLEEQLRQQPGQRELQDARERLIQQRREMEQRIRQRTGRDQDPRPENRDPRAEAPSDEARQQLEEQRQRLQQLQERLRQQPAQPGQTSERQQEAIEQQRQRLRELQERMRGQQPGRQTPGAADNPARNALQQQLEQRERLQQLREQQRSQPQPGQQQREAVEQQRQRMIELQQRIRGQQPNLPGRGQRSPTPQLPQRSAEPQRQTPRSANPASNAVQQIERTQQQLRGSSWSPRSSQPRGAAPSKGGAVSGAAKQLRALGKGAK